ncbi:MAG: trypsin-like peptidase domain-containing protein [Lachnospiraceae bacterium]|nr:trypsin-like peptidase domain-containing protein [Lachnospiraceae bacterium]
MKKTILKVLATVLLFGVLTKPTEVFAKEEQTPPHLIQSVTDADIYEGMLALGMSECPVLSEENAEEAYEIVKTCVVKVNMGNAYGSGVIWEMTPDKVIIVTNRHVLDYWDEKVSYIHFLQGYYADAKLLGVSDEYDVGFLEVDATKLGYEALEQIKYVSRNMEEYEQLSSDDTIFYVGAQEGDTEGFFLGSIGDMWRYIEEFEAYMIYGYGYARTGMSGGGTFDAKGNFIGMISGGTAESETASVPLVSIEEAYEEICP